MYVMIMMMVINCGGDDNDDTLFISLLPTNALPKILGLIMFGKKHN